MTATATREEVREAILDAADRLLARNGYRKMTIEDLAREVGIGKGSIYLHFTSKEEVALARVDRIVERVKERLRAIAGTEASAGVRLRLMLLARVMLRFDSVQHYTQSLDDLLSALRVSLLARRRRYFDEEARILSSVLEEGREAGEFRFDDTLPTARALVHATNSLLPYSLSTAELGERDEVRERAEHVIDLMLHGLLARDPEPPTSAQRARR